MRVLIIDNYDSFTYNLYQFLGELGGEVSVARNDAIAVEDVRAMNPSHIVLSPGPGSPDKARDFGVCGPLIVDLGSAIPILGVCLGHQGIIHHLGGRVVRAPRIVHGKTSRVRHDGSRLFRGLAPEIEVMRYHSLLGEKSSLPACLRITASTIDDD